MKIILDIPGVQLTEEERSRYYDEENKKRISSLQKIGFNKNAAKYLLLKYNDITYGEPGFLFDQPNDLSYFCWVYSYVSCIADRKILFPILVGTARRYGVETYDVKEVPETISLEVVKDSENLCDNLKEALERIFKSISENNK